MIWRLIAWIVTRQFVFAWLLRRGFKTPYTDITSADGKDIYMRRLWIFNPYGKDAAGEVVLPRWPRLPSVRLHHIRRKDMDRDLHNHPWPARTIVLSGYYVEERLIDYQPGDELRATYYRYKGYTGRIDHDTFHRITEVSPDGVWTLFITWEKLSSWGFMVDGKFVPWREYLGITK